MAPLRKFASVASALALAAIAGASGAGFVATSSETSLRSSFSTALGSGAAGARIVPKQVPMAGSEDFWLNAMRSDGKALKTSVSIGDRISMTFGGKERNFEIASVDEFAPVTQIDTSERPSRFVLITAKEAGDSGSRPVRFVMEIEGAPAAIVSDGRARAL